MNNKGLMILAFSGIILITRKLRKEVKIYE